MTTPPMPILNSLLSSAHVDDLRPSFGTKPFCNFLPKKSPSTSCRIFRREKLGYTKISSWPLQELIHQYSRVYSDPKRMT